MVLERCNLFADLDTEQVARVAGLAQPRHVNQGEYFILLGDQGKEMFVVVSGRIEVCLPLSLEGQVQDVAVEELGPGDVFGWSAIVRPYRFTLSARAAQPSEVLALPRQALFRLFEEDKDLQAKVVMRVAETIGQRLLAFQALWVRELQRALSSGRIGQVSPTEQE